ncbi:flagellar hook assembly protein FlgD [Brytella acorum]|uniref:Basal-body rod modification protein FlgD n=1 Tax=Brytella acorum TaxID=2959299 RepID=A0AA35V4S2_9PROT|nr:flagellar hook capping FlgD N-terminal domain-containing protein [Brytella acorum]MDF3623750.1 flagellar hook capping FlgD N-terminal domain-containing protein [Brytella acorum]CAI9119832.1 flagellar biosynthesis protein FlgD [Brytella acorum]
MSVISHTPSVSSASLLSAAKTAAKSSAVSNANSSSMGATSSSDALSSLADNYNSFLTLLTTQLQHQDPSSPMNTDSFSSELAQFAGVEQQVKTNSNLSTLISATQDNTLTSSQSLVGKSVNLDSSKLSLQNGRASVSFDSNSTEPVAIAITNAAGMTIRTDELMPTTGTNTWTWDGKSDSGAQLTDGAYNVAVVQATTTGATTALQTTTGGTVTGVQKTSNGVNVQLGSVTTSIDDLSAIDASNAGTATS